MSRRIVILTEGHSNPHTAKTACSMIRYRGEEVVALLDSSQAGRTCEQVLGVGGTLPVVASLEEVPQADTLLIGIAPPGGKIPPAWRAVVLQAIERGMNVVSGLHDFLSDDAEFAASAAGRGVSLVDVRKNAEKTIATRRGFRSDCLRVLTVGHDCSVGKMVTAIEVDRGLRARGVDSKFLATGQTGIMVSGEGIPIDCVVADFVSGAVERLVLANQQHDVLLIEGQGSLVHPSYSSVTLALLHGCVPQALILCYEVGRRTITGLEHLPIPPLADIKHWNETMARVARPCEVIAISMNSRKVTADEAEAERGRVTDEFGLPVCDVFRHGADDLVEAVLAFRERSDWRVPYGVEPLAPGVTASGEAAR